MTKQKMQLPLTCEKHVHDGYGTSKDVPCPWCEIELLRSRLAAALSFVPDDVTFSELRAAAEPSGDDAFINEAFPKYRDLLEFVADVAEGDDPVGHRAQEVLGTAQVSRPAKPAWECCSCGCHQTGSLCMECCEGPPVNRGAEP